MGIFGVEGVSPETTEGKCPVIFSFCQARLALWRFCDGLLCSFEANVSYSGYQEQAIEFQIQDKMSCWCWGQRGGGILERMKACSLHFRQRPDPGFHT